MKNITVIGAGVMGRGIAYTAAISNFRVVIQDISEQVLQNAKEQIEKDLEVMHEKKIVER